MAIDDIVWYAFTTFQYQLVIIQWKYFIDVSLLNWMQILHLTEQEEEKNEEACNKRRLFWCYLIYYWIKWDVEALYFVRGYTEECHVMTALRNRVQYFFQSRKKMTISYTRMTHTWFDIAMCYFYLKTSQNWIKQYIIHILLYW